MSPWKHSGESDAVSQWHESLQQQGFLSSNALIVASSTLILQLMQFMLDVLELFPTMQATDHILAKL